MLSKFNSYQAAKEFYRNCESIDASKILKQQLLRAASSIALNLAEGSAKLGRKEKLHHYRVALGSARECQAALDLIEPKDKQLPQKADRLGAMVYGLIKSTENRSD